MKILVLFYIFMLLCNIKLYVKNEDNTASYYKIKEEMKDPIKFIVYSIIMIVITLIFFIPLIILYINVKEYSELLAWLSSAQILIAIKHFIDSILLPSKMVSELYKPKSRIYKLSMISFDTIYIILVLQYLI